MNQQQQIQYDKVNDILNIDLIYPGAAYSDEVACGIYARINPITENIVGYTIFSYKKRKIKELNKFISHSIDWKYINNRIVV